MGYGANLSVLTQYAKSMKLKSLITLSLAVVLSAGISAPLYASETSAASTAAVAKAKRHAKKATKKKASNAAKTNTSFEGTVDGVNVKVYLNINTNWTGPVTGYYRMDGAKYTLKGKFVDESHIQLTEGYDDGIWNLEIGVGGSSHPYLWLNGTAQGGGSISLTGNYN